MLSLNLLSLVSLLAPMVSVSAAPERRSGGGGGPDANGKYMIEAKGIRAMFVPYGASISNLFINDTSGVERDIILGFDNATHYTLDKGHPHLGGVPGRYANRIKNSSFEIDGKTYNILPNEHPTPDHPQGVDTLHGGPNGWDWRNFTVGEHTKNSITFSIIDPDGSQGFPGEVKSEITYTVTEMAWEFKMVAVATTKKTPIMLSSHAYWNLDGFQNKDTPLALNHSLWMPYSGQRIGCDSILIPDGTILPNQKGSVNDFWSAPKQLGSNFSSPDLVGNCGEGCTGYDTAYLVNREQYGKKQKGLPVARLQSAYSGIQIDIYSEQEAFQVYSCNFQDGTLPLKTTQGFFNDPSRPRVTEKYGCIVMEVEDWIDAINQPEWQRENKQIYAPGGDPYVLTAKYVFSLNSTKTP